MGLINITDINTGDDATAELWNARFATLVNVINGNIDSANLADSAVTSAKIASSAVTSGKLADQAVTSAKLQDGISVADNASNPYKFEAHAPSGSIQNQTKTVIYPTETFDTGGNYDASTGVFTAPADGYYFFSGSTSWNSGANATHAIQLVVAGGTYVGTEITSSAAGNFAGTASGLYKMTQGQTAYVQAYSSYTGTGQGIGGGSFSGFMVSAT